MTSRPAAPAVRQAVDVASIAVCTALTVALGAIYLPLPFSPVAITGQTLGILLAANLLGARRGTASVALFLLLIAAGMPVLAGGRGGIALFAGPSGGYLIGFLLTAFVVGLATERLRDGRRDLAMRIAINATAGVFLVYLVGVPWLTLVAGRPFVETIVVGTLPYLPGDLFKAVIAAIVADRVLIASRRAGLLPVRAASGRAAEGAEP